MDDIPSPLLKEVGQVHFVANTPAYLYKHLVESQLYDRIRDRPVEDLLDLYRRAESSGQLTPERSGVAYCALIALVNKLEKGTSLEIEVGGFRWVDEIIEIAERKRKAGTDISIQAPRPSREQWSVQQVGSTDEREVTSELEPPTIEIEA